MKKRIFLVEKPLTKNDISEETILVAPMHEKICIGPKISRTFCIECYNSKIAVKAQQAKKERSYMLSSDNIISIYNKLTNNQICFVLENAEKRKKYLFPAVSKHNCNIINSGILKKCTYKNVYGILRIYKKTNENEIVIFRGILDIDDIDESFLTVSGKSESTEDALNKFLGESFERYIPQLFIKTNKYIFPLYKRLNGNAYEWRLDWTKPNMTTKGFASHKSRLKALKNGFYENIEHISLFAYMKNKTNLYEFSGNFQRKGQIELKSFLIENQFHIPVILTISKLQKKDIYGIGLGSNENYRKAILNSQQESLQILYEKKYLNLNNSNLAGIYKKLFSSELTQINIKNSFFIRDIIFIIKQGYKIEMTSYNMNLKNINVYHICINSRTSNASTFSYMDRDKRILFKDNGF